MNEGLCKVICHNLCVLIHAMFELGIRPDFVRNDVRSRWSREEGCHSRDECSGMTKI